MNGSLTANLTPFIGRQADADRLLALLRDPQVRLVSILGAGGIGKTRLALEIARLLAPEFEHSAVFVPLAQISSGETLLPVIAGALGVSQPAGGDLRQTVMEYLSNHHQLIVLDNFEHLLDHALLVRDLLIAGPQVKVLVTSREKLQLTLENLYHLSGMGFPSPENQAEIETFDAVRLFLQKAQQSRPGYILNDRDRADIAQICRMVDGNSLAILLAAAWMEHFSPAEIAYQMVSGLDFLSHELRDGEARHAGMRTVIQQSYDRLDERHQKIFGKLAVFRGGFDFAAAKAVAGADLRTLIALADRSLLSRDPDTGRYDLHELLRQFAREVLIGNGTWDSTLAAHIDYYMHFVQEWEKQMRGPTQAAALDKIQADYDNIHQAWSQVLETRNFAAARRALTGLYRFYDMRSRTYEAEAVFRQAVEKFAPLPGEPANPVSALALLSWYDMHVYITRFDTFDVLTDQARSCLESARAANDPQAAAASLVLLGTIAEDQGDYTSAIEHFEEAMQVYPPIDDPYWVAIRIGLCQMAARNYRQAINTFNNCLQRGKETGEQVRIGWSLVNIGDSLLALGRPGEAEEYLQQAWPLFEKVGTTDGLIWANFSLSNVALDRGDTLQARAHAQMANRIARETHHRPWIQKTEQLLARIDLPNTYPDNANLASLIEPFSSRELEVLQLLKTELSGPEIARRLVVSLNTLRFHTKNIYQKLGVNNRLEAIRRAKELQL